LSEYLNFHISNDDMIRISTKLDQHCRNDTHELMKNDRHYSHENSKHLQAYHSCMQTLRFPQQTTTNDGRGTFLLLFIILLFSFHTIRVARIVYQFILTAVFLNQKENVKAFSVPGFFSFFIYTEKTTFFCIALIWKDIFCETFLRGGSRHEASVF